MSFQIQLKPKLEWGLICLNSRPEKVDEDLGRLYHSSPSALRINRNIAKEYRDLPEMYQGLGMFNLNVDNLGARIYFIRKN